MKNEKCKLRRCDDWCGLLTVRGHEVASGDLLGVTEVWLDLLATGIKLPLMDATGFDVQHIVADLTSRMGGHKNSFRFSNSYTFIW